MYVTAKGPKSISATQTHTLKGELKKKKTTHKWNKNDF